ncbi:hypothetical protein DFJ74DRAFT_757078 [Hyaloraphidium curvatum]|nr:hypothetical protein DFJ74DRAFT_757078 [Hyaloraphidium curvatum]
MKGNGHADEWDDGEGEGASDFSGEGGSADSNARGSSAGEDEYRDHGAPQQKARPARAARSGSRGAGSGDGAPRKRGRGEGGESGKKFRCDQCGEKFGRIYELRRHNAIHQNDKSHVCDRCGIGFARKDALIRHMRSAQGSCQRRAQSGGLAAKSPKRIKSETSFAEPSPGPDTYQIQMPKDSHRHAEPELEYGSPAQQEYYAAQPDYHVPSPDYHVPQPEYHVPQPEYEIEISQPVRAAYPPQAPAPPASAFGRRHSLAASYASSPTLHSPGTAPSPSMNAGRNAAPAPVAGQPGSYFEPLDQQPYSFQPQPSSQAALKALVLPLGPSPVPAVLAPSPTPSASSLGGPFALLPLPSNLESLLELYLQHGWIHAPVIHVATVFRKLRRLSATPQTREDYDGVGMCPVLAQGIMWTAVRLAEDDREVERWGAACWRNIEAWAQRLGLVPGTRADPKLGAERRTEECLAFMRAGVVAGNVPIALGRVSDATRLREWCITAHRAAAFGSSVRDAAVPDGAGGWTTARDPKDLAAWIEAEERARTHGFLLLWDAVASDLQSVKGTLVNGGYVLRGGEIRCAERSGADDRDARIEPGAYNNVPLPCSDYLFEQLSPAPSNPKEVDEWLRRDAASGGIIKWTPIPYGEAATWGDLPYGSGRRKRLLNFFYGNFLRNGYTCNVVVSSVIAVRLVQLREFCLLKGYRLNDLPTGWSADEARAREMRDKLVLQIKDLWENLPTEVREADEEGDGAKLREIAARWWGPKFEVSIFMLLANMHGIALTLHSPRGFIQDLRTLAARSARRGHAAEDDPDDDDLDWTASPFFVIASSHAITVSKIIRSVLAPQGISQDGVGKKLVTGRASPAFVKSLSVLWPTMVLRAAWIHVLCIRKFQKIARKLKESSEQDDNLFGSSGGPVVSPDFLAGLLEDVDACLRSIDDMAGTRPASKTSSWSSVGAASSFDGGEQGAAGAKPRQDPWRYARLVHGVMRKVLSFGSGDRDRLGLTEEEIEELSLVKDITD